MRPRALLTVGVSAAFAVPAYFAAAALGSRYGVWDWKFGLGVLTQHYGPYVSYAGMVVCLAAAVLLFATGRRRSSAIAVALILIPAVSLGYLRYQQHLVLALPAIYDVQTDWSDPVRFTAGRLKLRAENGATNSVLDAPVIIDDGRRGGWAGMSFADAQAEGYPDIKPRFFHSPCTELLPASMEAFQKMNLSNIDVTKTEMTAFIEGTAKTFWYGLSDDVAVRLRDEGEGCRIDMRSTSREGHIDLGVNATRIKRFFRSLDELIATAN